MTQNRISILIEKFVAHELSAEETQELVNWIEEDANHAQFFNDHIELNNLLQKNRSNFDSPEAFAKIETALAKSTHKNPTNFPWTALLKYAAIFIGIIGLSFYLFNPNPSKPNTNSTLNFVTLELENGNIEKIDSTDQKNIINQKGQFIGTKKEQLLSYEKSSPTQKLVYNTLRIPYGKTFKLVLSDGTEIVLNSGTTIKYPVHFLPNQKRKVFLEGEAYFEVNKDSLRQFVVSTENQKVVVYGTKFNVSAYKNDTLTKTVLAEGSVGVTTKNLAIKLIPGEMAITGKLNGKIEIKEVNPAEYIAWTQNEMVFVSKKFSEIIKILERKFDVTIINKYKTLNDQVFTATFEDETLADILSLFAKSRAFEFTINENTITITKTKK